jgi:membrane protease YdiL (CAAX protease family)
VFSRVRRFWSWLLPPRRNYLVPWSGLELAAVVLLTELVWANLLIGPLARAGISVWQPNTDIPQSLEHGDNGNAHGESDSDPQHDRPKGEVARARLHLWVAILCFPLNVTTLILVPRLGSDTRPYQVSLTTHRLGRNVLLGVFAWFFLTPIVLSLNVLAHLLYVHIAGRNPTLHRLTMLSRPDSAWWELALVALAVLVAAPVWEELLYRGLLQRWLSQRWWGGWLACGLGVLWALVTKSPLIAEAFSERNWSGLGVALQPAVFVLLLSPGLLLVALSRRPNAAQAIYGTAALFAIRHSESWPDPVALFILALGLGWLADRTRSLVGPIVMHALFNGVACVMLFL